MDEPRDPVPVLDLTHVGGVARVGRDSVDGSLWLTAEVGSGEWWELSGFHPASEASDDVEAFAGRLPQGAATAELRGLDGTLHRATTGDGVWLVATSSEDIELSTLLFRDSTGDILVQPQPPGSTAEPIDDVDLPCPACGGLGWDLVRRPDVAIGGTEQVFVCRRCGHDATHYFGPIPGMSDIPDEYRAPLKTIGRAIGGLAKFAFGQYDKYALDIDFPVYGLDPGWTGPRSLAGYTTAGLGRAWAVELLHGEAATEGGPQVMVETLREEDERLTVEELLTSTLDDGLKSVGVPKPDPPSDDLSDPARVLIEHLREDAEERERAKRVATSERRTVPIHVNGEPVEFLAAESDGLTAAAAAIGELDVCVLARNTAIAHLKLGEVSLEDYEPD